MLRIRIGELSATDHDRLNAAIINLLLTEMSYPPFTDYRHDTLLRRPIGDGEQREIEAFVAAAPLDETTEITSSMLTEQITEILRRYHAAVLSPRTDLRRRMQPVAAQAPRFAAALQHQLVSYVLDGSLPTFGDPLPRMSWRSGGSPSRASGWEAIAAGTAMLASALATWRGEVAMAVEPIIAENSTEQLPSVAAPVAAGPLVTAPLPRLMDMPVPQATATPNQDRVIFTQLRQQVMQAMATALTNYRTGSPVPQDAAGLLAELRATDVVDDADLRLAEGVLALCARIVSEGRASLDDYRQAFTLYLLFHRSSFGHN